MDRQTDEQANNWTLKETSRRKDILIDRWKERQIDREMYGNTYGQKD